jgi:hypothetical protein
LNLPTDDTADAPMPLSPKHEILIFLYFEILIFLYFKNVTQWELLGVIAGEKFHAVRSALDDIFRLADEEIRQRVTPETLRALRREVDRPVTAEQRRMLKRLIIGISFDGMTRRDANELIHARLNAMIGRP